MIALLVLLTLLAVGGAAFVVVPGTAGARPTSRWWTRPVTARILGGAGLAAVVAIVSGWLVPGLVVGAGASWVIDAWQQRQRSTVSDIDKLDGLAGWVESVRDVLMAGEQPVGAIASTVSTCPPVVRPPVRRLAAGLGRQDPDVVFRRFADDVDDPLADLVAAGLAIAIRRGARTVPVLTALSEQTRAQVERRRLVEAERAPARREVKALTLIMTTLVVGLLVLGRNEYLAAYDTVGGQAFLVVALAAYAALIVRVERLAEFPRPGRFLTGSARVATGGRA